MIDSSETPLTLPEAEGERAAGTGSPVSSASGMAEPRIRRWWQRVANEDVPGADSPDDQVRPNAWVPIALILVIAFAFQFRFAAAQHLSSHIDESASVLAATMVADKGYPLFPSGTLYLQGATISYALAPMIKLGWGDLDNLLPLRMFSVIVGTIAVLFSFLLARSITRSSAVGFIAALLLAIDPVTVRWGGMVRMYALLQLLSLIVIWLFVRGLQRPPKRRDLIIMVIVFWFGVFTQIAMFLLIPPMAAIAFLTYGRDLLGKRRDVTAALLACCGAPALMMGLNSLIAPSDERVSNSIPGISFVGDFLFSADQLLHPTAQSFVLLFSYSEFGIFIPVIIVLASALLVGRFFLGEAGFVPYVSERKRILGALLMIYWFPIIVVGALATEQNERYLLHVQPIGLILVVLVAYDFVKHPFPLVQSINMRLAMRTMTVDGVGALQRPRPRVERAQTREEAAEAAFTPERLLPAWLSVRAVSIIGFVAVFVIGAAIRISHLNNLSLWLDEGFTALYSQQEWRAVSGTLGFYSPHPPLYFTMVKVSDLFVSNELAGRLISVVLGIATIPVFYLLIMKVLDRRAAFVSSLVLAFSPIHLYYSQEARMYATVVFLIALSYLALVSYNQKPRWTWAAVYGLSAALALWVDYSSTYALAPQAVFILVQFFRHRRAAAPLLAAGLFAILAYLPWIPQVLDSIDAANLVERREAYLGVDQSRVTTTLLAMLGIAGDGSYFQTFNPTWWNRWPDSRFILILAVLPVLALGVKALWGRWEAMAVIGGLLGTMLVGIWVSLISPGFAERTVLTTTLGFAGLVGAAFATRLSWFIRSIAVASLVALLAIQASTIDVIYNGAVKQQWRTVSADVELISPLQWPLVTYSYGAVADTVVDIYYPGLLKSMRVTTIRDGALENVLSNGVIPEVGLTRTFDLPAGKLAEALPQTPENVLVWYLYYTREGEPEVRAALRREGYTRVMHNVYRAPRYQVYLDLFIRPGANLGEFVPIDNTFAALDAGWILPEDGVTVGQSEPGGASELVIANQTLLPKMAILPVTPSEDRSLLTFSVEFKTALPAREVGVTISCMSAAGTELWAAPAEIPLQTGSTDVWRSVKVTTLCPKETVSVQLVLENQGIGEVSFRNPTLQTLTIPPLPEN